MSNLVWFQLPWALVALSAGVKFWRHTSTWRQRRMARSDQTDMDAAWQTLERIWEQGRGAGR